MLRDAGRSDVWEQASEPGFLLVLAVGSAELLFEDSLFIADAAELQRNEDEEEEQEDGLSGPEKEARDGERSEEINGIADAGVESGGDERGGFGADAEGASELDARKDEEG